MIELAIVLHAMSMIPAECSLYAASAHVANGICAPGTSGHYDRVGDALSIAKSISERATSIREAVEEATYAAYESANRLDVLGDCRGEVRACKSYGAWQTPNRNRKTSARTQLDTWIRLRDHSIAGCASNLRSEKLAMLASGSCTRGLRKVRMRDTVVEKITAQILFEMDVAQLAKQISHMTNILVGSDTAS